MKKNYIYILLACYAATFLRVFLNNNLIVSTGDGALSILELQMEGKKKMKIDDFLRGIDIEIGALFG